jgi:iron(III) transport system ATP-binding protein
MAGLAITGVGLRIGASDILRTVSLTVPPGRTAALLGPAGSGKTALLRAVAGLESPQTGSIRIGDRIVFDAANKIAMAPDRRGSGFMFQSGALWPQLSARDNLVFNLRARGRDIADARAQANRLLDRLGLMESAGRMPEQLCVAHRQRLALGRALTGEPRLLLLDEPLSGQADDIHERMWLKQLLGESGLTTLVATRDRTEAFALSEHIAVINAGAIEQEGAPADIFEKPATPFVASLMGPCNRIAAPLIEKEDFRACIEITGTRIIGVNCTQAAPGEICTGMIRIERVRIGGGPGANRIGMMLRAQTYLGERWEVVFVKDALTLRAYTSAPLKHEFYHLEFPPDALWIY